MRINEIQEPIAFFYDKFGFNLDLLDDIIIGNTYIAVILKNGDIGVSANLLNLKSININELKKIDINNNSHRNIFNAYINAINNVQQKELTQIDIFKFVNFSNYKNIVMVGFSKPMYLKLEKKNINISVFDYSSNKHFIKEQIKQKEYLYKADCVILTATSIANNTFYDITKNTNKCDIFMFGASSILHSKMFQYKNMKGIFGTVFNKNDKNLIQLIKEGHGQRHTKNHGKKVALVSKLNL